MAGAGVVRRLGAIRAVTALAALIVLLGLTVAGGIAAASGDPTAPTINSVSQSAYGASMFFTPPSQLTGTTITSYDFEVSTDGGTSVDAGPYSTTTYPNQFGNTGAASSPYTDPNAVSYCPLGTTCSYQIRAVYDSGNSQSPWSSWVAVTPFGGAPTLNSVAQSAYGASMFFTAPNVISGTTITSYDFEVSTDGGTSVDAGPYSTTTYPNQFGNTGAASSPYTDPNAVSYCPLGTTCSYRIRAEIGASAFQSPWSSWVAVTPFGGAPTLNSVAQSAYGASMFFTAPNVISGTTITSYDFEVSTDGGTSVDAGPYSTTTYPNQFGNTDAASSPYTDPNAVSYCPLGTTCSYRIRAEIGASAFQSPWSSWVAVTPFGGAPTLNSVAQSAYGASMFFTAPNVISGTTITSYDFEVSTDGGTSVDAGPYSTTTYPNQFGNTGAASSPYTDPNAVSYCPLGTTCSYRIRAEIGASAFQSPWSSWVSIGLPTQIAAAPKSGPAPLGTSFTLTVGDSSGTPVHYSLAFGDGHSTSGQVASPYAPITVAHTYAAAGTYSVGVTTSDGSGATGSAFTQVSATGTVPLSADAGGNQTATTGIPATFDGSGSQPSQSITSYQWDFGDGTQASGESVQHTYTTTGTFTATLTVGAGSQHATSQAKVTVAAPPVPGHGLRVTVTDGSNPLSGASLAVITSDGTRYPATTNAQGLGVINGLPDGSYSVDAYDPGYLPGTVSATLTGGIGSATLALQQGSVSQTSASSTRLDYQQILADGLDPNDPANQNVFKFAIHLAFQAGGTPVTVQVGGLLNGNGIEFPDVSGSGGGITGGGGDGGGGGGGGCSGCISFGVDGYQVVGEPFISAGSQPEPGVLWMIIPGQAQWLKEFFDVKMVVSNLAPSPFTFDSGSISLGDLPNGLSLAPTTNPLPSATQSVGSIPSDGSASADFVLRGDAEGYYGVSGTYSGTLNPGGFPLSFPISTDPEAIHVWGGSALQMTVDTDDQANLGDPYLVRIGLTNVSDIPVYNPGVTLLNSGRLNYIYQPGQPLTYSTDTIEPGQTFWTDYYRLIPEISGTLDLSQSFVAKTGGNADVPSTIESHPATPPGQLPAFTGSGQADGVHLSWSAPSVSGITGYEVFYTPTRDTAFGSTPVATLPASATSAVIGQGSSGFYAVSTVTSGGLTDYHGLVQVTAIQAPGTISLAKATGLYGNYNEKVSGSGWTGATTVSLNQCASTSYDVLTCDGANKVNVTLGTGRQAGVFKNAVLKLDAGTIDANGDTCGLATSATCYVVVVSSGGGSASSGPLSFTTPSLTIKKATAVLGNYSDGVTASGFPVGDTVVAQECDPSANQETNVASHCDGATLISGQVGSTGKVTFAFNTVTGVAGVPIRVGGGYTDTSGGFCATGTTCEVVVSDLSSPGFALSTSVSLSTPTATAKKSTAVAANYNDKVTASSFPIGDTVTARECDSAVEPATTLASRCDPATVITGTVGANGKVVFSPTGVTVLVGSAYSESGPGSVQAGGTASLVVSDSTSSGIAVVIPIGLS